MTPEQATARVKEIILARFPSQYQAAKSIGQPQSHLYNLFNRPSYNAALQLAKEFDIPFTLIIGD